MTDTLISVSAPETIDCGYYGSHKLNPSEITSEVNLDAIFAQLRWDPVALSADAFWASQIDPVSSLVKVYRGLSLSLPKGQFEATCDNGEEFLKQHVNIDRVGIHWSDNLKHPRQFADWGGHACECATCYPSHWKGAYLRTRILRERQNTMLGVWACKGDCDHCANVRAEMLKGCRCNRCVINSPYQCGGYCDEKAPCQAWRTVSAKEAKEYTDDKLKVGVAVVFEGETDIKHTLTITDKDYQEYKNKHGIYGYDSEQEITLRYQSPVHVTKVAVKSYHILREHTVNLTVTV